MDLKERSWFSYCLQLHATLELDLQQSTFYERISYSYPVNDLTALTPGSRHLDDLTGVIVKTSFSFNYLRKYYTQRSK